MMDRRSRGEGNGGDVNSRREDGRKRKESSSGSDLGDIDIKDDDDEEDEEKIIEQRRKQREELMKVSVICFSLDISITKFINYRRPTETGRAKEEVQR